jgi:hypothetical protein
MILTYPEAGYKKTNRKGHKGHKVKRVGKGFFVSTGCFWKVGIVEN